MGSLLHIRRRGDTVGKVLSYSKCELTRLRRSWLRRHLRPVLVTGALFVLAVGLTLWSVAQLDTKVGWYAAGLFHAGVAAALLHLLNSAVLAHEPTAIHQLRGSWGEDNTRSELETARKKKLVWSWVDSISLKAGDLDHVVVTRHAGVVVLDSKFHTAVTRDGVEAMTISAVRMRARAEGLARTLLKANATGRRRGTRTSVAVTPCVVMWGPARSSVPDDYEVDGVHFVDGARLTEWLQSLPASAVSKDAGIDFLKRLKDFRTSVAAAPARRPG